MRYTRLRSFKETSLAVLIGCMAVVPAAIADDPKADTVRCNADGSVCTMEVHIVPKEVFNDKKAIECGNSNNDCKGAVTAKPGKTLPKLNPNGGTVKDIEGSGIGRRIVVQGGTGEECPTWVLKNGVWYRLC